MPPESAKTDYLIPEIVSHGGTQIVRLATNDVLVKIGRSGDSPRLAKEEGFSQYGAANLIILLGVIGNTSITSDASTHLFQRRRTVLDGECFPGNACRQD